MNNGDGSSLFGASASGEVPAVGLAAAPVSSEPSKALKSGPPVAPAALAQNGDRATPPGDAAVAAPAPSQPGDVVSGVAGSADAPPAVPGDPAAMSASSASLSSSAAPGGHGGPGEPTTSAPVGNLPDSAVSGAGLDTATPMAVGGADVQEAGAGESTAATVAGDDVSAMPAAGGASLATDNAATDGAADAAAAAAVAAAAAAAASAPAAVEPIVGSSVSSALITISAADTSAWKQREELRKARAAALSGGARHTSRKRSRSKSQRSGGGRGASSSSSSAAPKSGKRSNLAGYTPAEKPRWAAHSPHPDALPRQPTALNLLAQPTPSAKKRAVAAARDPWKTMEEIALHLYNKLDPEGWFHQPVDTLTLTDYLNFVEKPMDMGTAWNKMVSNPRQYAHIDEMAADIRLIFRNCWSYNQANSPVCYTAEKMAVYFETHFLALKDLINTVVYFDLLPLHEMDPTCRPMEFMAPPALPPPVPAPAPRQKRPKAQARNRGQANSAAQAAAAQAAAAQAAAAQAAAAAAAAAPPYGQFAPPPGMPPNPYMYAGHPGMFMPPPPGAPGAGPAATPADHFQQQQFIMQMTNTLKNINEELKTLRAEKAQGTMAAPAPAATPAAKPKKTMAKTSSGRTTSYKRYRDSDSDEADYDDDEEYKAPTKTTARTSGGRGRTTAASKRAASASSTGGSAAKSKRGSRRATGTGAGGSRRSSASAAAASTDATAATESSADPVVTGEKDLTFAEKKKLSEMIKSLPPENLGTVVQIIQERMPALAANEEDDEIEFNIDTMDTATLRHLERFARTCMARKAKQQTRALQPGSMQRVAQARQSEIASVQEELRAVESALQEVGAPVAETGDADGGAGDSAAAPETTADEGAGDAGAVASTASLAKMAGGGDDDDSSDSSGGGPLVGGASTAAPTASGEMRLNNVQSWTNLAALDSTKRPGTVGSPAADGSPGQAAWSAFQEKDQTEKQRQEALVQRDREAERQREDEERQRAAAEQAAAEEAAASAANAEAQQVADAEQRRRDVEEARERERREREAQLGQLDLMGQADAMAEYESKF